MPTRCCCCPPGQLPDCGEIGVDYPVSIDSPDIRTPLWKSDDPTFEPPETLDTLTEHCEINEAALTRLSVAATNRPAVFKYVIHITAEEGERWAAVSHIWTGATCRHTGRLNAIPDVFSYAGPRYGVEIRAHGGGDLNNIIRGNQRLPLFGFGLCIRADGKDRAYSAPWFPGYSGEGNNGRHVPTCWASYGELCNFYPWEPDYSGAQAGSPIYPLGRFGTEMQGQFPNITWDRRRNGPFPWLHENWPPDDTEWEIGWYFILQTEPFNDLLNAFPAPPERLDWRVNVRMQSLCIQEQVRPRCSAAFAQTTALTLSVPDMPGAVPIEPSSWRGLSTELTPDEIPELTDVTDPRWLQSLYYWERAFVGTLIDGLGNSIAVSYVPCVSLALTITPADTSLCPIRVKIEHLGDCLDEGMVFGVANRLPDSEHGPDIPTYGCLGGAGVVNRYEPERDPVSYAPIALSYRVRLVNSASTGFPFLTPCHLLPNPCSPPEANRDCQFTVLSRAVGGYSYEGLSVAGTFRAEAAWLWFELRDAS